MQHTSLFFFCDETLQVKENMLVQCAHLVKNAFNMPPTRGKVYMKRETLSVKERTLAVESFVRGHLVLLTHSTFHHHVVKKFKKLKIY
jgi:hypothetical protein